MLEQENNMELGNLHGTVSAIRELTKDMQGEVDQQNRYLTGMGNNMDNTNAKLGTTMDKLNVMMEKGGNMHMCYLIWLIVFVFVVVYEGFIKSH